MEKSVEVLDQLAVAGEATVAQLAEWTGEPRSSMYRLLASLEAVDMVEAGAHRGTYRLGLHVLRLSTALHEAMDVRTRALPTMERLNDTTGLTVFLFVRRGEQAACIERLPGRVVSLMAVQTGGSLPLGVGAAPRLLHAYAADGPGHGSTEGVRAPTHSDQRAEIRLQGFAVSDGDLVSGVAAVAGPIFDHSGEVVAALSASGLREDVLGEGSGVLEAVIDGARLVSAAMGHLG